MRERIPMNLIGKTMHGRIFSFDRIKGYGFIRTSDGKDILFSSYDTPKRIWSKMSVGDYVVFVVGHCNGVVAENIVITKKTPRCKTIELPNGESIEIRHINKWGRSSLIKDGYGERFPNCPKEMLDCIFVRTSRNTFLFTDLESPVTIDGKVNLDEYYNYLYDELVKYE